MNQGFGVVEGLVVKRLIFHVFMMPVEQSLEDSGDFYYNGKCA